MAAVEVEGLAGRNHHCRLLLLLLLLQLFLNSPLVSGSLYLAVMEPNGTVNVMEGERLEVNCTLTDERWQQNCSASNMSIRLGGQPDPLTLGEQEPVSQYTVNMVIENASTNLSGRYYCYCNDTSLSIRRLNYIIGAPPHQPEITRIVLENLQKLIIYFDPVRSLESLNVNTTWSLTTSTYSFKNTTPCDVKRCAASSNTASCNGKQEEYVCQTNEAIHLVGSPRGTDVTITAENMYGRNSTTERQVKVEEYVQLYPVAVEQEKLNSTWVQLYWKVGLQMFYFGGIHYNLSFHSDLFQPVLFSFTCEVIAASGNGECETIRKIFDGLQPYTNYNLTWLSRPVRKGYWSKPVTTQLTTCEDVPKSGPPIQAWQYSFFRQLDNTHLTFIYPQDLRPEDKAGIITEYKYLVEGGAEPRREGGSPRSLTVYSYEPEGPALTVYLWACTKMGCSKNSSTIILPGAADRVAGPGWLDVEVVNDGHYRLYWESQDLQPSSQVQLHWCWASVVLQNQASLVSCMTEINSTEVDSTATNASLSVPGTEDTCARENKCSLQFGLSVHRDGHSSGIIWNTCIFGEGKEPESVSEVIIDSRQAPKEVKLTWQYPCQASPVALRGRPVSYQSKIGLSAGLAIDTPSCDKVQGPDQSSPARHGENSHLYKADLQKGENYLVCVRPLSSSLHGTAPWRVEQFSIDLESNSVNQIAGGVIAAILAAAFVAVIIICRICVCRLKSKNRKLPITTKWNASYTSPTFLMEIGAENDIPPSVELQSLPVSASAPPSSLQNGSASPLPSSQDSCQSIAAMTEGLSAGSAQDTSANSHSNSCATVVDNYQWCVDDKEPERNCTQSNPYLKQTGQQTDMKVLGSNSSSVT